MSLNLWLNSKRKKEINLLPGSEAATKLTTSTILLTAVLLSTATLACAAAIFYKDSKIQQQKKLEIRTNQLETGEWKKVLPTANLFSESKIKVSGYQKFVDNYPSFDQKLNLISQLVPSTVKFNSLAIDNRGKVNIAALARRPEDINAWIMTMKEKPQSFTDIVVSSTTRTPEYYTFAIQFQVK